MSQQIERLPKGKAVCLIDADSLLYYEMGKETLEEAMAGLDQRVLHILEQCNTTKYAGFLTQGKCFRYEVDVEYKAKRKKSNRSVLFPSLKEYAQQKWGFTYVTELEADDLVSYYSYNHEENTIICSPDKDVLKQCIGMHYNYGKAEFTHTSPDEALKFLWIQALMGDSTILVISAAESGSKTNEYPTRSGNNHSINTATAARNARPSAFDTCIVVTRSFTLFNEFSPFVTVSA